MDKQLEQSLDEFNLDYLTRYTQEVEAPKRISLATKLYNSLAGADLDETLRIVKANQALRRLVNVARILDSYEYFESTDEVIDFFSYKECRKAMVEATIDSLTESIKRGKS